MRGSTSHGADSGFALIAAMGLLAVLLALVVTGVPSLVSTSLDPDRRAREGVDTIVEAAKIEALRHGVFPNSLTALSSIPEHGIATEDHEDPFGPGDYRYVIAGTTLTVTSRGVDRRFGGGDDVIAFANLDRSGRARSRIRLRMIRSAFLRSGFMSSPLMLNADRARMRAAVHAYSAAQRALWTADAATRTTLLAERELARTEILSLRTAYSLPAPPDRTDGPSGLIAQLGLSPDWEFDGFGSVFEPDDAVGCRSAGPDLTEGTDDDL